MNNTATPKQKQKNKFGRLLSTGKFDLSRIKAHFPYISEFLLTFVIFFGRFLYYGWKYFPQLDDYIQYHNYAKYYSYSAPTLWEFITENLGLLAARPLAGLSDVFIISKFFSSMIVVVLGISLMYAASALILRYVFNKLFGTGFMFTAVFCLLPVAFEGLYWVSASSRIVTALFFASIAALFMLRITETGKIRYIPLFMIAQILSFGYYEQITILSVLVTAIIAIIKHNKYSLTGLLILANGLFYALYSQIASMIWSSGMYASRSELAIPFITENYFSTVFEGVKTQILEAAGGFMPLACMRALKRGVQIMIADGAIVYLILLIAVCALTAFLLWKRGNDTFPDKWQIILSLAAGIVLALAPLAPFFILKSNWIGIRAIVSSLCGVALIVDTLFRLITRGKRFVTVPLLTLIVFIACIASVSELHDYRATTEYDQNTAQRVVDAVYDTFDEDEINLNTKIAVLNIGTQNLPDQNYLHHEHVASATAANWSFTGLLRCVSGDGNFPSVTAMPVDENGYFYYAAHGDTYRLENYDYVFVATEDEIIRVTPAKGYTEDDFISENGEQLPPNYNSFLLYTDDIVRIARVAEYSYYGTFEFY